MKQLFLPILAFTMTCAVLSSCGTLSLTKRVHNNGYHVSYTKNYPSNAGPDEKLEVKESSSADSEKKENSTSQKTILASQKTAFTAAENSFEDQVLINATTTSSEKTGSTHKKTFSAFTSTVNPIKSLATTNSRTQSIDNMSPARDGNLSLLWIVVIVLLILWLLGYLGGVGSFIHLLLVIALILLILWLLRII